MATTNKLNLGAFNTPTRTEQLAFEKKVVKMTLKKVFAWMTELYCAGHHKEVSRLYFEWTLGMDYDTRAALVRSARMFNAGVRWEGDYEVSFVAPSN